MRLFLFIMSLLVTGSAYAADGIISYKKADGTVATASVVTPVCSSDNGSPVTCVNGLSAEAGSSGLINYKNASGMLMSAIPVVPVCSVNSDGVPQICDMSSTTDLSAYLTTAVAATTYVPQSQLGVDGGVATLDASGNVTAPINTTGTANTGALTVTSTTGTVQGSVSGTTKKWTISRRSQDTYTILNSYNGSKWAPFTFNDDGTMDSTVGVFANLGADAAFSGLVSAKTLTASTAAYVPDTTTSDSTTAALNTESAAARFIDKETVAATYQTIQDMNVYVRTISGDLTNPVISGATMSGATSIDGGKITTDGNGNLAVTGGLTAPTVATTDNSTSVATTAFVNNAFQAIEYSVQGDISTSGSSIQVAFGTSGLYAKFAYTGSGAASMSFCSSSGTLSPVDIRRNSIWGGSGVETYTLDNGSVSTSCVTADSTVYTNSQDSSAYFIRVGGQVYFLTVWASNAGARAFMGVHKMI